jgi:hypothetical protein
VLVEKKRKEKEKKRRTGNVFFDIGDEQVRGDGGAASVEGVFGTELYIEAMDLEQLLAEIGDGGFGDEDKLEAGGGLKEMEAISRGGKRVELGAGLGGSGRVQLTEALEGAEETEEQLLLVGGTLAGFGAIPLDVGETVAIARK